MKRALILLALLLSLGVSLRGQEPYFPPQALPDLIQSLPAPPEKGSPAFRLDLRRYRWGKRQRKDSVRVAQVCADVQPVGIGFQRQRAVAFPGENAADVVILHDHVGHIDVLSNISMSTP